MIESLKKCLVIGANGFIGSHLVDTLAENGFLVRAFDRYTNDPQFVSNENVEIFKGDLFSDKDIERSLKDIDFVFHSYSATTPYSSDADPFTDIKINLLRNVEIFDHCRKLNIKKIITISSGGAVYGNTQEEESADEDAPASPVSPYGICKLATEQYLGYFKRKFGTDYIVFRLTNPYGPRQHFHNHQGVIPAFVEKIKNNENLTILGDGTSSRDYIYITDATKMMVNAFTKNNKYQTYNIGSGEQTTVNQLVDVLRKLTNKKINVDYLEAPETFLKKSMISNKRYINEFGLPDLLPINEGITRTIN